MLAGAPRGFHAGTQDHDSRPGGSFEFSQKESWMIFQAMATDVAGVFAGAGALVAHMNLVDLLVFTILGTFC